MASFSISILTKPAVYRASKEAEAVTKKADASYYAQKKNAEGMIEMAKAYGEMGAVLGGPQGLLQFMMLEKNTHEKLALANAQAINGLQPKITAWSTGEGSANDGTNAIRNLMQSLPPLFSTINEQTGIAPPSWLAQMGTGPQALEMSSNTDNGKAKVNGNYNSKGVNGA